MNAKLCTSRGLIDSVLLTTPHSIFTTRMEREVYYTFNPDAEYTQVYCDRVPTNNIKRDANHNFNPTTVTSYYHNVHLDIICTECDELYKMHTTFNSIVKVKRIERLILHYRFKRCQSSRFVKGSYGVRRDDTICNIFVRNAMSGKLILADTVDDYFTVTDKSERVTDHLSQFAADIYLDLLGALNANIL